MRKRYIKALSKESQSRIGVDSAVFVNANDSSAHLSVFLDGSDCKVVPGNFDSTEACRERAGVEGLLYSYRRELKLLGVALGA